MRRLLWWLALLLTACPPVPVVPPGPADAATCATPAACACEALAALGCTEGQHPDCIGSTEAMMASRLTWVDTDCIVAATTRESVRACSGIGAEGCR
jgi:hypothetical protein